MRLERAIERFLAWRHLERDATPRSVDSYYRILIKLADDNTDSRLSDYEGRAGTALLRDFLATRYATRSASTRANVISVLHSFFQWAEQEDLIEDDPSRRIRRPPKRKPDVYRPSEAELARVRQVATDQELPAILLMEGVGLRAASVVTTRWSDIDLLRGRVHVKVKGGDRIQLPINQDVLDELRRLFRDLAPDLADHVFTVERELWASQEHRVRTVRDPKQPASTKSLWAMVGRVCERAGVRPLGPHSLRHGFATRLKRRGIDLLELRDLMGHSRSDTTEGYLDELRLEELEDALRRIGGETVTSVDTEGDIEGANPQVASEPVHGGGGNRTRVRRERTSSGDPNRTSEDDDPDLEPPERRHK